MRRSSKILLWVAVIAAVILIALSLRKPPQSARQQIAAQMDAAVAAANRQSAGGVMAIVSADYHDDNGCNVDTIHMLLSRALRDNAVKASLSGETIDVTGDTASSDAFVTVQDRQSGQVLYSHEVALQWRREPARSYLIFPSHAWRVVSASYGSPFGDLD